MSKILTIKGIRRRTTKTQCRVRSLEERVSASAGAVALSVRFCRRCTSHHHFFVTFFIFILILRK